ncbi:transcription factor 20-like isoform X2 [Melanotaenia boesemani]|nr:transcription factor 20-like isoform X2 [Melanotaenia boesemani]
MAMDLSKSYNPLTRSHPEAMDLAKKPEWYHRRPAGCSTDITSTYRSRASSSYSSLSSQPGAPVHCRDMEQGPESLGGYMNSALSPGLDLYHDRVHSNLWHAGFYGTDQSGIPVPESSGGEESDSGSDVIFLVSSAKEPLLCGSFIQDNVRHIVEPLSPTVSSLDEARDCYLLPQPMSSPSPDSSYSEDSSESSVDIPVHHTRPVVLLSDLSVVYGNQAESGVDISSDDSDVIEVSVTNGEKKSRCREKTPPRSESQKASPREVRRSNRFKKSVSETPTFTSSAARRSLKRQVKHDAVGIYNESFESDDLMEYALRLSSSEESNLQPDPLQRTSSNSEESDVDVLTAGKSPTREQESRRKASRADPISYKQKPLSVARSKNLRKSKQKLSCSISPPPHQTASASKSTAGKKATRRKRKQCPKTGTSALFSPSEPEIKLRHLLMKEKKDKKSDSFCPFVHMEKRMCRVVNYQEDEAVVRSSGGRQQQTSSRNLTGFVPSTSCFQLGRPSSDSRCQTTLLCCLCGQMANLMGLGDLHGPYYPIASPVDSQTCRTKQEEESHKLSNGHLGNSSSDNCNADKGLLKGNDLSPTRVPLHLDECWIHEDCGIWSAGVFLVRGKLYGLEEAVQLAQETVCSTCQQTGAIMGCFQKGCSRNYHYTCAIQSGCVLNEENFSMRCPEHKNKPFTSATRQHKR